MKRLQLFRWSGSVPSPRTRPYLVALRAAPCWRLQSTVTAGSTTNRDNNPPDLLPGSVDLQKFPSPPPYTARSSAKLAALHARLILPRRLPLETLARCLIHPTADHNFTFNNSSLSILGKDILEYHTSEFLLCQYPRLPIEVLGTALNAYCGEYVLLQIAQDWGVEAAAEPGGEVDPGLLQFKKVVPGNADPQGIGVLVKDLKNGKRPQPWDQGLTSFMAAESHFRDPPSAVDLAERPNQVADSIRERLEKGVRLEDASASFVRALIGAIYLHAGRAAAKRFFQEHFQSRKLDVGRIFVFKQPTRDLSRLCAREGFEPPVARMISETGRLSRHPVFVVGVFSGKEKLGEGQGASLDEARIRAAGSALKGWYLYSPLKVRVPSDVEGDRSESWTPVLVDGGEVIV